MNLAGCKLSFAETLKRLRNKAGKSRYQLWKFSGVDQSYISMLENGEKVSPSRSKVILLGMSLVCNSNRIGLSDVEELLLAAGFAPLRRLDMARFADARLEP